MKPLRDVGGTRRTFLPRYCEKTLRKEAEVSALARVCGGQTDEVDLSSAVLAVSQQVLVKYVA